MAPKKECLKNTWRSRKGTRVQFPGPTCCSQPSLAPVLGNMTSAAGLCGHQKCMWHTHTRACRHSHRNIGIIYLISCWYTVRCKQILVHLEEPWAAIVVIHIILANIAARINKKKRLNGLDLLLLHRFEVLENVLLDLKNPADYMKFCSNIC